MDAELGHGEEKAAAWAVIAELVILGVVFVLLPTALIITAWLSPRWARLVTRWRAWRRRPKPLSKSELRQIPVFRYADGDDDDDDGYSSECVICIDEFVRGDRCRSLPRCGHRFHADCIKQWLRLRRTCPMCRASVFDVSSVANICDMV